VDWHDHEAITIPLVELRGEPSSLSTEDEDHVIRSAERGIPEESLRLGREEERLAERGQLPLEVGPAGPDPEIDVLPIIQAGPFHLALVEGEAEGLDEM